MSNANRCSLCGKSIELCMCDICDDIKLQSPKPKTLGPYKLVKVDPKEGGPVLLSEGLSVDMADVEAVGTKNWEGLECCPFCLSNVKVFEYYTKYGDIKFKIVCLTCPAEMPGFYNVHELKEHWNNWRGNF